MISWERAEPEFVNVEGAQEWILPAQAAYSGPVRQIGLSFRPARLHGLAESFPWNSLESIPGFLKSLQIRAQSFPLARNRGKSLRKVSLLFASSTQPGKVKQYKH
jgi:hypothetical protein